MEKRVYEELFLLEKDYWWHVAKRRMVMNALKKNLNGHLSNSKILDAGCGTGIMLREFSKAGFTAYGVDISPLALKFCRKRGDRNLCKADLNNKSPYESHSFKAVTALDVIEHLDNDYRAVKEFYRILCPGGHLYITVPAFQFLWTKHDDLLWHKRRYTTGQLAAVLRQAGFLVKKITYFHSFLFPFAFVLYKTKLMFNRSSGKTSVVPPKVINGLMVAICAFEAWFLSAFSLPFGLSILAIAEKK